VVLDDITSRFTADTASDADCAIVKLDLNNNRPKRIDAQLVRVAL